MNLAQHRSTYMTAEWKRGSRNFYLNLIQDLSRLQLSHVILQMASAITEVWQSCLSLLLSSTATKQTELQALDWLHWVVLLVTNNCTWLKFSIDLLSLSTHAVLEKAKGYSLLWSLFHGPQLGWVSELQNGMLTTPRQPRQSLMQTSNLLCKSTRRL